MKLYYAIRDENPFSKTEVVDTLEKLLKCVSEAFSAHDTFPYLDDTPLKWLWINEMTRHVSYIFRVGSNFESEDLEISALIH